MSRVTGFCTGRSIFTSGITMRSGRTVTTVPLVVSVADSVCDKSPNSGKVDNASVSAPQGVEPSTWHGTRPIESAAESERKKMTIVVATYTGAGGGLFVLVLGLFKAQ